ncbi:MAG TPA: peptide-methionine (R)-S-oxide reductase [Syntrophomonas sp.]|jgi:peptide-methionine (R)-S-oxide reductase|nr:peptide-methionine (R)-S-oxide reductase [Syntrophomonas sp.]
MAEKKVRSEEEWKAMLDDEAYRILRQKGTEMAFHNKYYDHHEKGIYCCAGCGQPLFSSEVKYESGSGWPSFYQPLDKETLDQARDLSHGMIRTEVMCKACGGHLGHVFPDGPRPTGMRFCINSGALDFKPEDE